MKKALITILIVLALSTAWIMIFINSIPQETIVYCNQISDEELCDKDIYCHWGELTPCAIPGVNCGAAYTPAHCIPKEIILKIK